MKHSVDDVSKEAQKITKEKAPVGNRKKYKKNIKVKTAYESLTEKRRVVYVANGEHRLTHLLEKGHAKVNGGRTKAIHHFSFGEDYVLKNLVKVFKNKLGGK